TRSVRLEVGVGGWRLEVGGVRAADRKRPRGLSTGRFSYPFPVVLIMYVMLTNASDWTDPALTGCARRLRFTPPSVSNQPANRRFLVSAHAPLAAVAVRRLLLLE